MHGDHGQFPGLAHQIFPEYNYIIKTFFKKKKKGKDKRNYKRKLKSMIFMHQNRNTNEDTI